MSTIVPKAPIWPGSGSLSEALSTPFEFYTSENIYVTHSVQTAVWCAKRLGYPITDIELQGDQMYACFEEAVTEYSAIVNQYNIKENMLNLRGAPTSSNYTHTTTPTSLGSLITVSSKYGSEAGVGGDVERCELHQNLTTSLHWAMFGQQSTEFRSMLGQC